jgi:hypothetical protein
LARTARPRVARPPRARARDRRRPSPRRVATARGARRAAPRSPPRGRRFDERITRCGPRAS